jgi:hypothetical protein
MFYYGCISYHFYCFPLIFCAFNRTTSFTTTTERVCVDLEKNYTYRPFHILYAVLKTQGTLSRYHRWEVSKSVSEVELLAIREQHIVNIAAGPKKKKCCSKPYVWNALAELNSVLASISKTVQGFPLPVMLGCVNMLRNLNSRYK